MLTTPGEMRALSDADLEAPLAEVERCLAALGASLCRHDAAAVEHHAAELHRALAVAIGHFSRAARAGDVPLPLRRRLAVAGGLVAAQREALARATASLDRAIDVLLPGAVTGTRLYGATGAGERPPPGTGAIV